MADFKMTEIKALISSLLLSPLILPLMAAVGLMFQKKVWVLRFVKLCIYLFLILSLPVTENIISGYWESIPPFQLKQTETFLPQAIVVIGGGIQHSAFEYPGSVTVTPGTMLRLRYAAKIAKETNLPVMTSGGVVPDDIGVSEASVMADVLQFVGMLWYRLHD